MIWIVIAEAVAIVGLAGACVAISLGAMAKIADLQQAARAERFELHERIRHPESRPVAIPVRRRSEQPDDAPPKDLTEIAKVGVVVPMAPPSDNENGVAR